MKKWSKIATISLVFAPAFVYGLDAKAATVTVAVERFTLGQGYVVEPEQVNVTTQKNYAGILEQVLQANKLEYTQLGTTDNNFYLTGIKGIDTKQPQIPSAVTQLAQQTNTKLSSVNASAPTLGEYSYSPTGGWLYSVNNQTPTVGMSDQKPTEGDVFRVQFSLVGYGADLGQSMDGQAQVKVADKTALTKKIAEINQDKASYFKQGAAYEQAYQTAMAQLENLTASQTDVEAALQGLNQPTPVKTIAMYRLYNHNSGEHFYTASVAEKNNLVAVGWTTEGIGWQAPASGEPVYRVYNPNAGDHHYTLNAGEKNNLVKLGWQDEGTAWYSGGSQKMYRLYNPNAQAGAHHYTLNVGEKNNLLNAGWQAEGIGWYAE
ncbi:DUF4430 domain-containing protein [Enterococcus sp. CSURQ0835]|uniref:DUF4430 domain-containing protein n=1 Tax=Enterococcus sp. CSURQ0835 TaxID=2681394 RepID=UPI00135ADFE0|nr:DUF4430 domain-containing protein [Enterococcus sp. CSURQ0835]